MSPPEELKYLSCDKLLQQCVRLYVSDCLSVFCRFILFRGSTEHKNNHFLFIWMESSRGFKSNPGAPSFIFDRKKKKKRPVILGVHGSVQDEIEDLWKALNGLFWGLKKAECWIMLPSRRGHPESKRNSSVKWHLCVSILQDRSLLSICIHLKPLQVIFMDSNLSVPPLKDPPGALEFFFFFMQIQFDVMMIGLHIFLISETCCKNIWE